MLDKRSLNVLKALNKLSETGCFKVATCEDILSILQNKSQYDIEKQITPERNCRPMNDLTFCRQNNPFGIMLIGYFGINQR